jgi:hypothetical protein
MGDREHWADRPILRDLFWFLVLPHQLKQHLAAPLPPSPEGPTEEPK